jgi:hypothetical protein
METMDTKEDLGNTEPNLSDIRREYRRFCFTLNNWTEEEHTALVSFGKKRCKYWIIGKEIGEKNGVPHLQGYMEMNGDKKIRFSALKKICRRMNFRECDGDKESNVVYCSKDKEFIEWERERVLTLKEQLEKELLSEYDGVIWKEWQQKIIEAVKEAPDARTVNWYWEPKGNVGKSYLYNYLSVKYNCIICDGTKENIFNQCLKMIEDEKKRPEIIILNIPRNGYVNYRVLEQLKDRVIYSGKYEGGKVVLPKLHLYVFGNEGPEYDQLSEDRWNVQYIIHQ